MAKKITHGENATAWIGGPIHYPDDFGHLIRLVRRRQGLTLEEVYSATGLTTRFLSEFERGKSNPSLGGALQAAQALGLEVVVVPRARLRQVRAVLDESGLPSDGNG